MKNVRKAIMAKKSTKKKIKAIAKSRLITFLIMLRITKTKMMKATVMKKIKPKKFSIIKGVQSLCTDQNY